MVKHWLHTYGWIEGCNVGTWHHDQEGTVALTCQGAQVEAQRHALRESWRRSIWTKFVNSERRDGSFLNEIGIMDWPATRFYAGHQLVKELGIHALKVMTGAAISNVFLAQRGNYHGKRKRGPPGWLGAGWP